MSRAMSDSDAEFERFLQESLSGSSASCFSASLPDARMRLEKEQDEYERKVAQSGWLKNTPTQSSYQASPEHTIELTLPSTGEDGNRYSGGKLNSNVEGRGRTHFARYQSTDDPLNFSAGSGYSILSELEHHLAMTGNSMRSPGPDTLNEEEEKRRFFAELEQSTSSLNYSELNWQLGNTAPSFLTRGSLGNSGTMEGPLKTIQEDSDTTPHYSEDEFETSTSGSGNLSLPPIPPIVTENLIQQGDDTEQSHSSAFFTTHHSGLSHLRSPRPSSISPVHSHSSLSQPHVTYTLVGLSEASNNSQATAAHRQPITGHKKVPLPHKHKSQLESPRMSLPPSDGGGCNARQNLTGNKENGQVDNKESELEKLATTAVVKTSEPTVDTTDDLAEINGSSFTQSKPEAIILPSSGSPQTITEPLLHTSSPSSSAGLIKLHDVLHALTMEELSGVSRDIIRDQQTTNSLPTITSNITSLSTITTSTSATATLTTTATLTSETPFNITPTISPPKVTTLSDSASFSSLSTTSNVSAGPQSSSPIPPPTVMTGNVSSRPKSRTTDKGEKRRKEKQGGLSNKQRLERERRGKQTVTSGTGSLTSLPLQHHSIKHAGKPKTGISTGRKEEKMAPQSDQKVFMNKGRSGGGIEKKLALQEESHRWQSAWEQERQRVRELEEHLNQVEKKEARMKLAHSHQVRELEEQLLVAKRQVDEKSEVGIVGSESLHKDMKDQETLIIGYQKENERLYSEVTRSRQEMKDFQRKMAEEKERHAAELALTRNIVEQLSDQLRGVRNAHNSGQGSIEEERYHQMQSECQLLQDKVEELTEIVTSLQQQYHVAVEEGKAWRSEMESLKERHSHEVATLHDEVNGWKEECQSAQQLVTEMNEKENSLLQQINRLQKRGQVSKPLAEGRRVKVLAAEVEQLQEALRKCEKQKHQLISGEGKITTGGRRGMESLLAAQLRRLEEEVASKEKDYSQRMSLLQKKYHNMECLYEDHVHSLKEKLSLFSTQQMRQAVGGKEVHVAPATAPLSSGNAQLEKISRENQQLKEELDQIQAAHDKECSKFQSKIAELEEQCGKQQETAVHEMAKIQEHHNQQMGDLVARYARHNLHTDVVRLQSRLEAKEAAVKLLQEQLAAATVDRNNFAAVKKREEKLGRQVKVLTEELLEAKQHHTPEMAHYSSLLTKIRQLETRLGDYCTQVKYPSQKGHSPEEVREMQQHFTKQLQSKDHQIMHYREELDAIMATLVALQEVKGEGGKS